MSTLNMVHLELGVIRSSWPSFLTSLSTTQTNIGNQSQIASRASFGILLLTTKVCLFTLRSKIFSRYCVASCYHFAIVIIFVMTVLSLFLPLLHPTSCFSQSCDPQAPTDPCFLPIKPHNSIIFASDRCTCSHSRHDNLIHGVQHGSCLPPLPLIPPIPANYAR